LDIPTGIDVDGNPSHSFYCRWYNNYGSFKKKGTLIGILAKDFGGRRVSWGRIWEVEALRRNSPRPLKGRNLFPFKKRSGGPGGTPKKETLKKKKPPIKGAPFGDTPKPRENYFGGKKKWGHGGALWGPLWGGSLAIWGGARTLL